MFLNNWNRIAAHLSSLKISSITCIRNKFVELTALDIVEAQFWKSSEVEKTENNQKMFGSSKKFDKFKKILIIIQH